MISILIFSELEEHKIIQRIELFTIKYRNKILTWF